MKKHLLLVINARQTSSILLSLVSLISFLSVNIAEAQQSIHVGNGAQGIVQNIICPVFNAMFYVLMAVSVIMILWAAFLFVTSQNEEEKITRARKTITYAAVGIVVALVAAGFPALISSIFGVSGSSGCGLGGGPVPTPFAPLPGPISNPS